jgi:hypothetical protein
MGSAANRRWLDKLRDWRRSRRERAVERKRHRSEHVRRMESAGKSPGGSQYYDADIHGGGSG